MQSLKLTWMNGRNSWTTICSVKVKLWQVFHIFHTSTAVSCLWLQTYKDAVFCWVTLEFTPRIEHYSKKIPIWVKKVLILFMWNNIQNVTSNSACRCFWRDRTTKKSMRIFLMNSTATIKMKTLRLSVIYAQELKQLSTFSLKIKHKIVIVALFALTVKKS